MTYSTLDGVETTACMMGYSRILKAVELPALVLAFCLSYPADADAGYRSSRSATEYHTPAKTPAKSL